MNNLIDFIQEKLKVGSKTKIHTRNPEDWTIKDAEDGDIIKLHDYLYFIYKCLNKDKKYKASEDAIVYHIVVNMNIKKVFLGPDTGIGTISDKDILTKFALANDEECNKFLEILEEEGFKWDETKLEIVKI